MVAGSQEARGLAHGAVGSARVIAFGTFAVGRHGIVGFIQQADPLGYLTSRYWSRSVLWTIDLVVVLTGLSVVLVYLAVNIAVIRAFRTEFRKEFRLWRHLVIPGAAALLFLSLVGVLLPPAYTLMAYCRSWPSDGSASAPSPLDSSGPGGQPPSRH
jgi:amino acid transporter